MSALSQKHIASPASLKNAEGIFAKMGPVDGRGAVLKTFGADPNRHDTTRPMQRLSFRPQPMSNQIDVPWSLIDATWAPNHVSADPLLNINSGTKLAALGSKPSELQTDCLYCQLISARDQLASVGQ
uniref:Uncharacterized protein n=1 Tax=Eutreptiella gymnastica TaxID=73025 RepID=A0A7S1I0K5_9EUGL|mmetsp:Transcript_119281/g.207607  ORF Transcript_119281/g.207607 Transcript_119281/m.207607 type:complete len:127 (+) Transcript_119281:1650-2030(+)